MADPRAREQLRQERAAFEQASRHDKAWFLLRLAMGYLGLTIILLILVTTVWVMTHPSEYGSLQLAAAALSMTSEALAISYGIVRLVLQQSQVIRLEPTTMAVPRARSRAVGGAAGSRAAATVLGGGEDHGQAA